ncbi:unnamed protein product [Boreogadus saida]
MGMSRGTSTFLACFTGFWLLWALVAALCCLGGALRRRLKSGRERRSGEQCLRTAETGSAECSPRRPAFCPPLCLSAPGRGPPTPPEAAHWVTWPDSDRNPPCYEEAVLMDDPPPSYNEVLADPLQGRAVLLKPPQQQAPPLSPWELQGRDPEPALQSGSSKPPAPSGEQGYCSLIQLPSARHWDGLGQLLSDMDHRGLLPETRTQSEFLGFSGAIGMPGFQQELHEVQEGNGPDSGCGLRRGYPVLGRSTAV